MKIKIENKRVLKILEDKNKYVVANQNLLKEMNKLEKEFNTNMAKAQRADEKVRPIIKKDIAKIKLGEYEELSRLTNEKGYWELDIVDRLEEFKKAYKSRDAK